jgi:hypothetical protein
MGGPNQPMRKRVLRLKVVQISKNFQNFIRLDEYVRKRMYF